MTLNPLESSTKRYPIVGWDSEFCPYHGGPDGFVVGAFSLPDGTIHTYRSGDAFVDDLVSETTRGSRLYAHNVEVDIARALEPFLPQHHDMRVLSVGYRVLSAQVHDNNEHYWQFRDSSQISYYASLEDIGDLLDYPKLDPDVDLGLCLCDLTEAQVEDLARYCGRDADLTRVWVEELQDVLVDEFDAPLDRTAAGTSMGVWRRNHQDKIYPVLPPWHRDFIRESYRGGRTEMFRQGVVDEVHGYDINSLYPYCYGTYPMPDPNSCMGRVADLTVDELLDRLHEGEGVARVTVSAPPDLEVPYLRYWHPTKEKLVFPQGTFTDTYTYLELREAIKRGYQINEVHRLTHFASTVEPFSSYADQLYSLKQRYGEEDDSIRYRVVKLLLNSFYGRFGLDTSDSEAGYYVFPSDVDELREHLWETDVWTNDMINAYEDGDLNYYFDPFDGSPPPYAQPEWATYITAAARHELYTWFEEVGLENVVYCDTDSVYATEPLPDRLLSEDLGGMDHEYSGPARFFREKGYVLFEDSGSLSKVKASGLNFRYLGDTEAEQRYTAYLALVDGKEVESAKWSGITGTGMWGTVEPQVKRLGESWVPKRVYHEDGSSRPLLVQDVPEEPTRIEGEPLEDLEDLEGATT